MPPSSSLDRLGDSRLCESPKDIFHDSNIFIVNNSAASLPFAVPPGKQELEANMVSLPQTLLPARSAIVRQRASTMPSIIAPPARSSSLRRKPNVTPDLAGTQKQRNVNATMTTASLSSSDRLPAKTDNENENTEKPDDDAEEEVTSCLMSWKRHSALKLACRDSMFTDDDSSGSNAPTDIPEEWQTMADSFWRGQDCSSFVVKPMTIASFLGGASPTNQGVLRLYLSKFDFTGAALDEAFRMLCAKLFFKAEAQEIDRILEAFAHRYYACNDSCLYKSADIVYSVIYSLMLLNTDLHIARAIISGHTPMASDTFVDNTLTNILELEHEHCRDTKWQEEMRTHLEELYISVKKQPFVRPTRRKTLLQRGVGSLRRRGTKNNNNKHNNNNTSATPLPTRQESLPTTSNWELTGYLSFQANISAYYRATITSGYLYISSGQHQKQQQQQHQQMNNVTLERSKSTGLKYYYHSCANLLRSKSRSLSSRRTKAATTDNMPATGSKEMVIALAGCRAFPSDLDVLLFYVCLQNGRTLMLRSESQDKTKQWVQHCAEALFLDVLIPEPLALIVKLSISY